MSNRGERRRQEREKRKQPVLMVGDGIVAKSLGHQYEARPGAQLRPKVPGRHRWVATGAWVLSDDAAKKANDPDTMKFLDHENLMHLAIGCWDCERPLGEISADSRCPAKGDE